MPGVAACISASATDWRQNKRDAHFRSVAVANRFCDDQFRFDSVTSFVSENNLLDKTEDEKALFNAEEKAKGLQASGNRRSFCEEAYGLLGPAPGKDWMHRKQSAELSKAEPWQKEAALRLYILEIVAEQYCRDVFRFDGFKLLAYLKKQGVSESDQEPKGDFARLLSSSMSHYYRQAMSDRKGFCEKAYDSLGPFGPEPVDSMFRK